MTALWPPFHAEMVPFRSAKIKRAACPLPPFPTLKEPTLLFETWPVGPCGPVAVIGMATKPLGGLMLTLLTLVAPETLYSVVLLVPWSETQNGLPARSEMPQGFTSCGSVMVASPGMSEARFV